MRERILSEAVIQLKAGGYENLSFTKISEMLGTSRANLHHHFKDKEGLALEATQYFIEQHLSLFNEMSERHRGDYTEFLVELEERIIAMIEKHGNQGICICSQLVQEQGIPESVRNLSESHFEEITELFKSQIIESQEKNTLPSSLCPNSIASQTVVITLGMTQLALAARNIPAYINSIKGILTKVVAPSAVSKPTHQ